MTDTLAPPQSSTTVTVGIGPLTPADVVAIARHDARVALDVDMPDGWKCCPFLADDSV